MVIVWAKRQIIRPDHPIHWTVLTNKVNHGRVLDKVAVFRLHVSNVSLQCLSHNFLSQTSFWYLKFMMILKTIYMVYRARLSSPSHVTHSNLDSYDDVVHYYVILWNYMLTHSLHSHRLYESWNSTNTIRN